MKEQDYIDATNLAKARVALNIVADIMPIEEGDIKNRLAVLRDLSNIISKLEKKVSK